MIKARRFSPGLSIVDSTKERGIQSLTVLPVGNPRRLVSPERGVTHRALARAARPLN